MRVFGGRVVALGIAAFAGTAAAQPKLASLQPANGASIAAPDQIAVIFSDALNAKASTLSIQMSAPARTDGVSFGGAQSTPAIAQTGVDPSMLQSLRMTFSRPLAPGFYTLRWRAVGGDGKAARGVSSFTVR